MGGRVSKVLVSTYVEHSGIPEKGSTFPAESIADASK